jgi:hypothetical protein
MNDTKINIFLCQEDSWRSRCIALPFLTLVLVALPLYPWGNGHLCPLYKRLNGPQSRFEYCELDITY